jgi:hypothetical protein
MGQTILASSPFIQILLDEFVLKKLMQSTPIQEEDDIQEEDVMDEEAIEKALYEESRDVCSQLDVQMNLVLPTPNVNLEEEDIELVEV